MRIISEKTGKEYATVAECEAAEKEFDEKAKAEQEKKEALAAERTARAKEVEAAYQKVLDARKEYSEVLNAFCKDYGSFHMTYRGADPFEMLWDLML